MTADVSGADTTGMGEVTAMWLLVQGWTATAVGRALDRDAHTTGRWAATFAEGGPNALPFEQSGPPR